MPAVLVHGVPDTAAMWDPLVESLGRDDTVALELPAFGAPRPEGFPADKEAYVGWLLDRLAEIDGPIDLVGHDWGCLLVVRAVCLEPERVRTWAGGSGPIDPDYTWHETAQLWQTPEVGEQVMEAMTPEVLSDALVGEGVDVDRAEAAANRVDDTMKHAILELYRSAVDVGAQWWPDLWRAPERGLICWGAHDSYAPPQHGRRMAEATGAAYRELPCGHWWPVVAAESAAELLRAHWADDRRDT